MNEHIKRLGKLVCYGVGVVIIACGLGTMTIVIGTNIGIIVGEIVRTLHG